MFHAATSDEVARACAEAWEAFYMLGEKSGADRAAFLDRIADNIAAIGDELISWACSETGLTTTRIVSERERTIGTLRMFAGIAREGSWIRAAIDTAEPSRRPLAKPDVRSMLRPLGPVAVFGASNFPLAYSTAGGDTASALAAGCPVVVKGHPSHPGTGELVARAIHAAVMECGLHPGTFSFLHAGGAREIGVGQELVKHPCIRAVGFTGSFAGGTALAEMASARRDPIPVYAEMGSINPVFVLPQALASQAKSIAERLFTSITNSNGQMCTCPGLVFVMRGDGLDHFTRELTDAFDKSAPNPMLSGRIRRGWVRRLEDVLAVPGVEVRGGVWGGGESSGDGENAPKASPVLLRTKYDTFRSNPTLKEECFGPSAIVVVCERQEEMIEAATLIQGSLTAAIFAAGADAGLAKALHRTLELRVGRLVYNGVTTGVEVCAAMVHGGPFPASNHPESTAVGPRAIERWCRQVCYQNAPEQLLQPELRMTGGPPIWRRVDGELKKG